MKRNETAYELAMDDLTMGVHETIPTTTLFTIVKEMWVGVLSECLAHEIKDRYESYVEETGQDLF